MSYLSHEQSWDLEPSAEAPRQARHCVDQVLQRWELDALDTVADVLTSELVTNAVRHAGTGLVLRVTRDSGRLRIEVEDGSSLQPELRTTRRDELADAGYGLVIVDRLADRWGWEPTPRGKRVWIEIEIELGTGSPG